MDFEGCVLCERMYMFILLMFSTVGWIWAWNVQKMWIATYSCAAGLLVSYILCVPDWPWFNRHPLSWQQPKVTDADDETEADTEPIAQRDLPKKKPGEGGKNRKAAAK